MKYKTILANGFWVDTNESFTGMVVALESWDVVDDAEDEKIFYYLDGADPIGNHGDFFITDYKNNY